ncbi:hypothetical protein ACFY7C_02420 [Streptomyces sp. NPDC012769]|uniref:hypothetical protein n=1 Tax=Streptomyces sp. NPDC012769 TaxID=3364848 RepID=UPI0036754638
MSDPQSRAQRHGGRSAATPKDLAELKARQAHKDDEKAPGAEHRDDRRDRGGRAARAEKGVAPDGGIPTGHRPDEP